MCEESPRVGSLDEIRHEQAGNRKKDSDADETETTIESRRPAGIAEMVGGEGRSVKECNEQGSHAAQALNREILVSHRAGVGRPALGLRAPDLACERFVAALRNLLVGLQQVFGQHSRSR